MRTQPRSRNWAGNITFGAEQVHEPRAIEQLQELVATTPRVRALGSGHSFNEIADTTGRLVSVADLPPAVEVDADDQRVTVPAGMRYGEVAEHLQAYGLAVHNLGSLPHISVAGACATGTHGSGDRNRTLAGAVRGIELVGADGELVQLARGDADFDGAVVSLGGLGVVTRVTLEVEPTFDIRQYVYEGLPMERLRIDTEDVFARAYSVSVFTDWQRPHAQVWLKTRAGVDEAPGPNWLDATLADVARHPVPGMPAEPCTEQLGVVGPWYDRLPHFRLDHTPSTGKELQSEYLLPRPAAAAAFEALSRLGEQIAPVLQMSEVRTIAAEELWLSPSQGRDTVGIHFTWQPDEPAVRPVVAAVEEALLPLGARPHWAKVFVAEPEQVWAAYPRWADFRGLLQRYDPAGKFRNAFMDRYFPMS